MPLCNGERDTFTCYAQNNQNKKKKKKPKSAPLIPPSAENWAAPTPSPRAAARPDAQPPLWPAKAPVLHGCCWLDAGLLRTPALSTPVQDASGSGRLTNHHRGDFCCHAGCHHRHHYDPASTCGSDCNTAGLRQWLLLFVFLKGLNKQETG